MTAAGGAPPTDRDDAAVGRSLIRWIFLAAIFTAGIGELVVYFVGLRLFVQRYAQLLNPAALWLVPLLDAPLFGALAGATWLVMRRWRPALATTATVGVLLFLAVFEPLLVLNSRLHLPAVALLSAGIAASLTRGVMAWPRAAASWTRWYALFLGTLSLAGSLAWTVLPRWREGRQEASLAAPQPNSPSVILVVLDAVRASALHLYGGPRENTPLLDSLGRLGVVFDHAYATTSWTLPSHASLFTGRYPAELVADWATPFGPGPKTLSEYFAGRGYATGGFSGNLRYVSRVFGLSRGFQHFADYPVSLSEAVRANSLLARVAAASNHLFGTNLDPGRVRAQAITHAAGDWALRQQRPYFLFLNLFDGHEPYDPPPPYDTLYSGLPRRLTNFADLDVAVAGGHFDRQAGLAELYSGYQAAIRYQDAVLDSMLGRLAAAGKLRNTVVIVTADHGDLFGEYGLVKHGDNLYSMVLHVPLVWYMPGALPPGQHSSSPVSLRDIPATLAALTGDSATAFPGRRLLGSDGIASADHSPVLSSLSHFPVGRLTGPLRLGDMTSLISGSWHFIVNGDGGEELYDLRVDSLGRDNAARRPELADTLQAMRRRLEDLPVSEVTRRYLRRP